MTKVTKVSDSSKYVKYVKAWEDDPRLKNWIAPMAGDIKAAYCKVCRRPMHPQKKALLLHSKCKKHTSNMLRYETAMKACQPLKDAAIESEVYEISSMSSNVKKIEISIYPESANIFPDELEDIQVDSADIVIDEGENLPFSADDLVSWKNIPEFQGWLSVKSNQLSCNVCKKELKPNKTILLKQAEEESSEEEEDESPEEKEKRKVFETKRKQHYNEYAAVKLARKLMEEDEEEETECDKIPEESKSELENENKELVIKNDQISS